LPTQKRGARGEVVAVVAAVAVVGRDVPELVSVHALDARQTLSGLLANSHGSICQQQLSSTAVTSVKNLLNEFDRKATDREPT